MILRAQCSFGADLPDVKHRMVITPHFNAQAWQTPLIPANTQALADDLAAALNVWAGNNREINVKLYNAEQQRPSYPVASKTLNLGLFPASNGPRELAICLSYRAGDGPRRRGRLYLPATICNTGNFTLRPPAAAMDKAAALASPLRALGGADIQWGVWSRRDNAFYATETATVDNEWDIVRSRGLVPTARISAGSGS